MELKIKPIVNNLFHATVTHEGFEGTAVGYTKDEATKKALGWLKREIEAVEAKISSTSSNQEFTPEAIENRLDEQALYTDEFLKDDVWESLENEEAKKSAIEIVKLALKATRRNTIGTSRDGLRRGNLADIFLKTQTLQKIQDVLSRQFDLKSNQVTLDCHILNDFQADGLDIAELVDNLEEEFDIAISEDLLSVVWHSKGASEPGMTCTVGELLDYIHQQISIS